MDEQYFNNYCGYGPYEDNYVYHSGIEHCVHIVKHFGLHIDSVLVLGTATGQVLRHFESAQYRTQPTQTRYALAADEPATHGI